MKFSVVFTTLFAALASAVPQGPGSQGEQGLNASRPDGGDGRGDGGDGRQDMKQIDLEYLLKINEVDLRLLLDLGRENNLNVRIFEELFRSEVFSIESLLQLQQLATFLAIAETGVFDRLDLSRLSLDTLGELNLGLIENIARVDLGQFIDDNVRPQIIVVVQQINNIVVVDKDKDNDNDRDDDRDGRDGRDGDRDGDRNGRGGGRFGGRGGRGGRNGNRLGRD